jgi:PAS domain-containing protein
MDGESAVALQRTVSQRDLFHSAANLITRDEYGTLILDRAGRIRSCGEPAEHMFAASQVRLIGRRISDFIAGLHLGGRSPSYSARYLAYLSASGEWRKYDAKDIDGRGFAIELKLSQVVTDGREMFLLTMRKAGGEPCA